MLPAASAILLLFATIAAPVAAAANGVGVTLAAVPTTVGPYLITALPIAGAALVIALMMMILQGL